MSITTNEFKNAHMKDMPIDEIHDCKHGLESYFEQLTVSTMIKTMLEIIRVKNIYSMDDETRKQFPAIAREIALLADQTQ